MHIGGFPTKGQLPLSHGSKDVISSHTESLTSVVQQILPKAFVYQTTLFVKSQVKECVLLDGDKKMFRLFAEACFFRRVEPDTLKTLLLDTLSGDFENSSARKNFDKKISRYYKKWLEKLKVKQPADPLHIFEKYTGLCESKSLDKKSKKILEILTSIQQRNYKFEEISADPIQAFLNSAKHLQDTFLAVKALKKDDGRTYNTPTGEKIGFEYEDFRRAKKGVKGKEEATKAECKETKAAKAKANAGYVKLLQDKEIWNVISKDLEAFKAILQKNGITDEKVIDKIDTIKKKIEKKAEKKS